MQIKLHNSKTDGINIVNIENKMEKKSFNDEKQV